MVCFGLEPREARCKSQTNPLIYDGTNKTLFKVTFNWIISSFVRIQIYKVLFELKPKDD